ncbi:MAG: ptsN2 [Chlamydiales bacterium]|jgi:PTS system nitrogen regulatory IIA component|nr:ptsN2 [Chlamydiales bacterium]
MDLKIKDVAELLNVSETTIRRWLTEGKIPAYRINSQYRFSRVEIENWVMGQRLNREEKTKFTTLEPDLTCSLQGGIKQFSLYRAIHKGQVYHQIEGDTKEEVIRQTMKRGAQDLGLDADVIADLLLDREKLMATSLNHGIGVPHTRDFYLSPYQDSVIVVFLKKPIDYGALDEQPVHTLFFLFASDDKQHLNLLAKIAHLSSLAKSREFFEGRPEKSAMMEYIKDWEGTLLAPKSAAKKEPVAS